MSSRYPESNTATRFPLGQQAKFGEVGWSYAARCAIVRQIGMGAGLVPHERFQTPPMVRQY